MRSWDVATGKQHDEPLGHNREVWDVEFSPDGKLLASASADKTVRLWELASGQSHNQELIGHNGPVMRVAFSPDGKLLVSASLDKTEQLWDVEVESLIADACRIANHNLSRDEWSRFVGRGFDYARTCSGLPAGEGAT